MDLAKQVKETKSKPWSGASNVKYPMLTTAALQFAARSYPAIIQGPRIVKVRVLGYDQDGSKALAADRVSMHMSHQFMSELDGWEDEVDTLLHQIPIVGCAFRKTYYDPSAEAGFCSDLVSAFDLVVNNKAKNLDKVPRWTHRFELYPYEIQERQADGRFREDDEDGPKLAQLKSDASDDDKRGSSADQDDTSSPQMFLEQHRYWDSDGDGVDEPWIVTVHKSSRRVVRLKANYDVHAVKIDEMRGRIVSLPKRKDCGITIIPFIPDPAGGIYAIGFGKLLEAISDVVDTTINQMMDAGTLQNAGGGFIGSGLKLGKTRIVLEPGKWQNVDATGVDVKNAIVPMVHPGPSTVLFQLLGMMVEAGKDVASVKDVLTGDAGKTMTATATAQI
jgi:chaperonin GroES